MSSASCYCRIFLILISYCLWVRYFGLLMISVYNTTHKKPIVCVKNKLQVLQNLFLYCTCWLSWSCDSTLYSVHGRYLACLCVFLYKIVISKQPSYQYKLLVYRSDEHNVNLMNVYVLFVYFRYKTQKSKCSFQYLTLGLYNSYIELYRRSGSVNVCRSRIIDMLIISRNSCWHGPAFLLVFLYPVLLFYILAFCWWLRVVGSVEL